MRVLKAVPQTHTTRFCYTPRDPVSTNRVYTDTCKIRVFVGLRSADGDGFSGIGQVCLGCSTEYSSTPPPQYKCQAERNSANKTLCVTNLTLYS